MGARASAPGATATRPRRRGAVRDWVRRERGVERLISLIVPTNVALARRGGAARRGTDRDRDPPRHATHAVVWVHPSDVAAAPAGATARTDAEAPRTGARSTVQPTTNRQSVESSASSARLWRCGPRDHAHLDDSRSWPAGERRLTRGLGSTGAASRPSIRSSPPVSLARPFTYEVGDDVGEGRRRSSLQFGARSGAASSSRSRTSRPTASTRSRPGASSTSCRRRSSTSRCGRPTTTARRRRRALALVAPPKPARRGERRSPSSDYALGGEAEPLELSEPQRAALARIEAAVEAGGGHFLLYGATGSGKTEVYLQACAAAIERGQGAIVLVPEIALTPQTLGRFRRASATGSPCCTRASATPSGATSASGSRPARRPSSSARAPRSSRRCPRLGLVCVDEEHDPSYKQESDPRYDARTVAAKRAALEGAVAVYGSATPRPESWARLERLELGARLGASLPPVTRRGHAPRGAAIRSRRRSSPSSARLERDGGKAILLLNRRGLVPALHCRDCGETRRCANCDVALVLHRDGSLRCHHCGDVEATSELCPACGSPELVRVGAGTQRLERELERQRARARADPARRRHRLAPGRARRRRSNASREPTAPSCSGRRWSPRATTSATCRSPPSSTPTRASSMPDFRAEERTFQLVTQLAGRSGRTAPGRVIVQTFQPDARAIVHAARHDVTGFLSDELRRREELGYPPFRHVVRTLVGGPDADDPATAARRDQGWNSVTPTWSDRHRCCACAAGTAPSSSRRPPSRGGSHRRSRACSPPQPRRCAVPASPPSSTSIPQSL